MPNVSRDFSQFELSASQAVSLRADFTLLMSETDLSRCSRVNRIIAEYKQVPGIYFWVMRQGERLFRIYIGKTNSMAYRMQNYVGEFQPHSPNDYKLRIFRSFLAESTPDATLDLYFSPQALSNITQAENVAVAAYDPLLNRRQRASAEARAVVRDVFALYYRSAFEQLLRSDS